MMLTPEEAHDRPMPSYPTLSARAEVVETIAELRAEVERLAAIEHVARRVGLAHELSEQAIRRHGDAGEAGQALDQYLADLVTLLAAKERAEGSS